MEKHRLPKIHQRNAETELAMLELNVRRGREGTKLDLLPWADPYIMQLFLGAELAVASASDAAQSPPSPACRCQRQTASARQGSDEPRGVNSLLRLAAPRRRRTEPERSLVRC